MKKTELPLSSLTPDKGDPRPKSCEGIRNEVNALLMQQCAQKFNALKKCNSCEITHPEWPIIHSPADAKLINTAYDGSNGFLNTGNDLHWEAGEGTASSFPTTWIPAYVLDTANQPGSWVNSPFSNSNWISIYKDGKHSKNVDIYFRYRFYLGSDVNPAQFALDMDFYADNCVHEIYVNGNAQSLNYPTLLPQEATNPYGYHGFNASNQVQISLGRNWKACENEIIVHVKSGPEWIGFLAQNTFKCLPSKMPELAPVINISWGDSECDCLETDDYEVMCIRVCNPYSDVTFGNFVIGKITVLDALGQPVALLPDGTPSVELHPVGPYCFGNLLPCSDNGMNCIAREFILFNRGAIPGKYKIVLEGICFDVCKAYSQSTCFEMNLCKS